MGTRIHIFESLQLESSYVGDLLYCITANEKDTFITFALQM